MTAEPQNIAPSKDGGLLLMQRPHPIQAKADKGRVFYSVLLVIPLLFHLTSIVDRSQRDSIAIAIGFEIIRVIVSFIGAWGVILSLHWLLKSFYSRRMDRDYTLHWYFSWFDTVQMLPILFIVILQFDGILSFGLILELLAMIVIYIFVIIPYYLRIVKSKTSIYLKQDGEKLYLIHGFDWRISYHHIFEISTTEDLPVVLLGKIKENDKWYDDSYEYRATSLVEPLSEYKDLALYLPFTSDTKELILVDRDLGSSELMELLTMLETYIDLVGLKLDLYLSKKKILNDGHKGWIRVTNSIETEPYEIELST